MTDLSRLTVAILTYNSGSTIAECLDSLVEQRFPDFDVVIVDDDSTDGTVPIASSYSSRLKLTVVRNGTHNIPRGRNIGIAAAQTDIVAFLDSDDCAAPDWTQVAIDTFRKYPETALVGGRLTMAYRTTAGRAIATNDDAIRRLFMGGMLQFCAGNSAVNLTKLGGIRYNEEFKFAEDLELASRVPDEAKRYVPELMIRQYSRGTLSAYAKQMYRYGYMKVWVSFAARSFRFLDFVPLALFAAGAAIGLVFQTWWPLLLNIPFALAEAIFVICFQRCPARVAVLTFPAWLVKNLSWSVGICAAFVRLAVSADARRITRSKPAEMV